MGGGSNILADDAGFAGLVLLVRTRQFEVRGNAVHVGAGWDFDQLDRRDPAAGADGLEFASGIPGTVGGHWSATPAATATRSASSSARRRCSTRRSNRDLRAVGFRIRLQDVGAEEPGEVVLDVVLGRKRDDPDLAGGNAGPTRRSPPQAPRGPSLRPAAGSGTCRHRWRRPSASRPPAPDAVGARDMREGGAAVFAKHANIIINAGGATAPTSAPGVPDARRVQQRFGVDLDPEVRHLVAGASTSCLLTD